jgi:ribosomal protein S18 acetylase RimI-like enzyme
MDIPILQDLSAPAVTWAIEANFQQWWSYYRYATVARFHEEPEIVWLLSGIPLTKYNGVIRATFAAARTKEKIKRIIRRLQAHFAAYQVGVQWFIGPSTTPTTLGCLLEAQGFHCCETEFGMALDLEQIPPCESGSAALEIVRVASEADLADWTAVATQGYGEGVHVQAARLRVQRQLGWTEAAPLRRYLGRVNGRPVATSALFLGAGVAGVYEVVTLPDLREQGIDEAMTRYALQVAQQHGYRVGVLVTSPLGLPLYCQLGFEAYCQFEVYVWRFSQ